MERPLSIGAGVSLRRQIQGQEGEAQVRINRLLVLQPEGGVKEQERNKGKSVNKSQEVKKTWEKGQTSGVQKAQGNEKKENEWTHVGYCDWGGGRGGRGGWVGNMGMRGGGGGRTNERANTYLCTYKPGSVAAVVCENSVVAVIFIIQRALVWEDFVANVPQSHLLCWFTIVSLCCPVCSQGDDLDEDRIELQEEEMPQNFHLKSNFFSHFNQRILINYCSRYGGEPDAGTPVGRDGRSSEVESQRSDEREATSSAIYLRRCCCRGRDGVSTGGGRRPAWFGVSRELRSAEEGADTAEWSPDGKKELSTASVKKWVRKVEGHGHEADGKVTRHDSGNEARQPLVRRLWIAIGRDGGGFWQQVSYDFVPSYCTGCCRIGHALRSCRRLNVRKPLEEIVPESGTPPVCRNEHVKEGEQGMPTAGETVAIQVMQGLEELARKGIEIDHFVDEAVLEAAMNIIDVAAGNVMKENGVGEVKEDAQEPNAAAQGLEVDLATPSPTLGGVKGDGDGTGVKEMVQPIGSSPSLSFNTWAKGMKEKWGPERGKLIDDAKQEVLHYFENAFKDLGQSKYDEMEPQLLEEAGSIFVNKLKEAESKEKEKQDLVKGKVQEGEVCSTGSGNKKKEWELHEWALLLREKWEQDEVLGDIIENSLSEIRAYLRKNHGGWLEKFDSKAASEASSILKCKIEASSIGKKYGSKSRLGWGLKYKHLSTGYLLYDWARKYFSDVIEEDCSDGSGRSEDSE
nr:uncharacterized protein LOC113739091 [Ipomoea batatas]